MIPQDNPDNPREEINKHTTSIFGVRLYHLRTLLFTYLIWAIINLFYAFMFSGFTTSSPLIKVPYFWVLLNIAPLWGLILSLWEGDVSWFTPVAPGLLAGLIVITSLFINRWWARFLVIVGMSIWFFVGLVALGVGA